MKRHFQLIGIVVINLIVSFLVAVAVAMFVPVEAGTTKLDRDYSSYSKDELRGIVKEQSRKSAEQTSLLNITQDRGIALQILVWLLGIFLVKRADFQLMLYWGLGLAFGLFSGLFSLSQCMIIFAFACTAFALKKFMQRNSTGAA